MSLRIGLLDVCAILVLLVVLFLPPQGSSIVGAYAHRGSGDKARDVDAELARASALQATLWAEPGNGEAAREYAEIMSDLGRFDMALRIGGQAALAGDPSKWRSLAAVSDAYADLRDIAACFEWAEKALDACTEAGETACPVHEALRLRLHIEQLRVGVGLKDKGFDPKFDPDGFRHELSKTHRTMRSGKSE